MCLAIPGKIISFVEDDSEMRMAKVSFGEVIKTICMDLLPEAVIGNFVLIHVGFGISIIDENEADETMRMICEMAD